ncbi:MAG: hypothetical protein L0213_01135, partial [Candidatus Dadabacteria bacterium]|nr:hypothetical protein [Candidatus Dadabacteria bacterium]
MMRKISGSMVAILLFCSVNVLPAHANGSPQWVTGEVVSIVEKQDDGLISLKLADGALFSISSKPSLLEGVEIGDVVT